MSGGILIGRYDYLQNKIVQVTSFGATVLLFDLKLNFRSLSSEIPLERGKKQQHQQQQQQHAIQGEGEGGEAQEGDS